MQREARYRKGNKERKRERGRRKGDGEGERATRFEFGRRSKERKLNCVLTRKSTRRIVKNYQDKKERVNTLVRTGMKLAPRVLAPQNLTRVPFAPIIVLRGERLS